MLVTRSRHGQRRGPKSSGHRPVETWCGPEGSSRVRPFGGILSNGYNVVLLYTVSMCVFISLLLTTSSVSVSIVIMHLCIFIFDFISRGELHPPDLSLNKKSDEK